MSNDRDNGRELSGARWKRLVDLYIAETPNGERLLAEAFGYSERTVRRWSSKGDLPGTAARDEILAFMGPRTVQRYIAQLGFVGTVRSVDDDEVDGHLDIAETAISHARARLHRNHLSDQERRKICGRLQKLMQEALACHQDALPRGRPDFTREGELPFPPSGGA